VISAHTGDHKSVSEHPRVFFEMPRTYERETI